MLYIQHNNWLNKIPKSFGKYIEQIGEFERFGGNESSSFAKINYVGCHFYTSIVYHG